MTLCLTGEAQAFQSDASYSKNCGVNALYLAAHVLGQEVDLAAVQQRLQPTEDQTVSLRELRDAADELGLYPLAVKLPNGNFERLTPPAILHVKTIMRQREGDHFILLIGTDDEGNPAIVDPPNPPTLVPAEALATKWTGRALLLFRSDEDRARANSQLTATVTGPFWREPSLWLAVASAGALGVVWARKRARLDSVDILNSAASPQGSL